MSALPPIFKSAKGVYTELFTGPIHDIAKKHDDYATEIFMHEYIREQIEEEHLALDIIDKFTSAGDSIAAKYSVDKEFLQGIIK